jgi:DNA repair protein RadC
MQQKSLFTPMKAESPHRSKFISTYRVALVRDRHLPFEQCRLANSQQTQPIIRKLIETHGQSDREQFCVLLLNAKNKIIGLNIVSTGSISSAPVAPRDVIKVAILANSAAIILSHNHPSGDVEPSPEDLDITEKCIHACHLVDITVHEHIIVSMFDDRYYSMADNGIIKKFYDEIS